LIIKEQPSQYISSYGRDPYYYKELLSHDNILFANNISSLQLIKNSQCVITSTGTSGIETIVLNKKLIMLGNNHYSIFKSINKVKTYEELSKSIENLGELKRPSLNERVKFFYHYKNAFFDGNIESFYKKNSINKEEFDNELNIYSDSLLEIIKKLYKFKIQKFF
jgi:capsule polysaccharide export protein KpsC/LpsZ